jgi:predicted DNA-binding transcriptional regulator AlpA
MRVNDLLTPIAERRMLTVPEVGRIIQKSPKTVRRLAAKKALPGAVKVGGDWRFQRGAIERYAGIPSGSK